MNTITTTNTDKTFPLELLESSFQRYKNNTYSGEVTQNPFGEGCEVIEGIEGFTFIKFSSRQLRDDIANNFPKATAMNQKLHENGRHIPELVGSLDNEEDYYLIVSPNHNDTDEINPEIGVFKGMIINPSVYFSDTTQQQIDQGKKHVTNTLEKKN